MPRLGYKKSRKGCLRCKQRRVKCDEKQPCSACARHGVACIFPEGSEAPARSSSTSRQTPSISGKSDSQTDLPSRPGRADSWTTVGSPALSSAALSPDPFPYFAKFVTGQEPVEKSTWLTDLELMHHYTSTAFMTLPRAAELQHVWQVEIPKLALSHVFLLHQVLSVSAYHLAYLHPDRPSLPICGSQHQNKAVVGLRSAVATISEENCPEIFVTSSMLYISAFASFSSQRGEQPRIDDLLDVFTLVQGMSDILNSYTEALNASRISDLFIRGTASDESPVLTAMVEHLRQFKIPDKFESEAALCQESIASAITWTENCITTTHVPDLRIAMSWSLSLSAEFMDLVRQRHPVALGILAHYCVVLHHAGLAHWFLGGWGRPVLLDIYGSLDPEWRCLVEWPMAATER
ncbi:hypothetical protein FDECE_9838 [Fusarium decemcellulare]|nr:hypothetical protein FDECE_9838 [Fusarium decemcellulare]